MFGVGYTEAFIIAVVALVVFGPQRLPELAGQAGRWIREFRKMTSDLTGEFEKTIAEVDDIRDTVRREMKSMMDEVDTVADSVKSDLSTATGRKPTPAKLGSGAAKTGTTSAAGKSLAKSSTKPASKVATTKTSANGIRTLPLATKADPLVDVSLLDDGLLTGPTSGNGNASGIEGPEAEVDAALVRVRQRRATAAYGRRG